MKQICDKHGEYEAPEPITLFDQVLTAMCPLCDDETAKAQQAAAKAYELRRLIETANIEPEHENSTLEAFNADTEELSKAVQSVRRLLSGEVIKLVLTGRNGTGKTHLAVAAILAKNAGRIMTMYEISARIRASYTSLATRTEFDIVDELARLPLLAIDEMGRTKGSDAEMSWLSYILDKRHTRRLPTILISNKHVRKDCADKQGCSNCLENFMGEDVMSRLSEDSLLVRFNGDDWRRKR
jgi:DNA replication protein DnaC